MLCYGNLVMVAHTKKLAQMLNHSWSYFVRQIEGKKKYGIILLVKRMIYDM